MPDGIKSLIGIALLAMAYWFRTRSSCLDRKVGAVIVIDKTIIVPDSTCPMRNFDCWREVNVAKYKRNRRK
jgi:deoxycytidylate deaminase